MDFIWFYKLFISAVTFTGDYAYVWNQLQGFKYSHGDQIMILDTDYEIDMKYRRLTVYYVSNNWFTRLLGFEPKNELQKLNKYRSL